MTSVVRFMSGSVSRITLNPALELAGAVAAAHVGQNAVIAALKREVQMPPDRRLPVDDVEQLWCDVR